MVLFYWTSNQQWVFDMSPQSMNLEPCISRANCVVWDPDPAGERRGETEVPATRSFAVKLLHTNQSEAIKS